MLNLLTTNRLFKVNRWAQNSAEDTPAEDKSDIEEVTALEEADVVTSERKGRSGRHSVVLDIDVPAELIGSTTPGHSHLFIDTFTDWESYARLLDALADAGVIERGYADASKARGFSAVRVPWKRKLFSVRDRVVDRALNEPHAFVTEDDLNQARAEVSS